MERARRGPLVSGGGRRLALTLSLTLAALALVGARLEARGARTAPPSPARALVYELDPADQSAAEGLLRSARRATPDQGFTAEEGAWWWEEGRLHARGAHNAALWLPAHLPRDARVELSVRAEDPEGDAKCELFGDGATHKSGYILINGGWKNTVRAIARRDEHDEQRREDKRCAGRCAPKGVEQRWVIERRGGVLSWYIDGRLALELHDDHPLTGVGVALNAWEAHVSFGRVRIYDITPPSARRVVRQALELK